MSSLRVRFASLALLACAASVGTLAVGERAGLAAPEATEEQKATARTKLVEGGEMLKQGDYKDALVRFQEAYDLVPSPKIQYNFGLAYMGLGRSTAAMEAFDKFLSEAPDASPDLRANAERYRSTLSTQTASVSVVCDVDGAEISADGRSYGTTPRALPLRLDPGPHQLVVEKAGVPPFTAKLSLTAGQRQTVEVKLADLMPKPEQPKQEPQPVVPVQPVTPPPPEEHPMPGKMKAAIGVGAGAVALLAFGVFERLQANSKYSDFNNATPAPYGKCDADDRVKDHGGDNCSDLLSSGRSAATLATVGLIGGGVLAAGAVTLFVLARKDAAAEKSGGETVASACAPTLFGQTGIACDFRF